MKRRADLQPFKNATFDRNIESRSQTGGVALDIQRF